MENDFYNQNLENSPIDKGKSFAMFDVLKNILNKEFLLVVLLLGVILYYVLKKNKDDNKGVIASLLENFNVGDVKKSLLDKDDGRDQNFIPKEKDIKGSTLDKFQAKAKADALFEAMQSSGTNEELIFETLKGCSYADYLAISFAFGKRGYSPHFGTTTFNSDPLGAVLDLTGWLYEELSDVEMKKLKDIAPNIKIW